MCIRDRYKVVYYVKVTESNGQAVKLGQMLEDDVFQNKDYMGKTLLNERPLEPLDPDDPASNTQAPGSDYHYTRLPKALSLIHISPSPRRSTSAIPPLWRTSPRCTCWPTAWAARA